jgi:hypothetical protein
VQGCIARGPIIGRELLDKGRFLDGRGGRHGVSMAIRVFEILDSADVRGRERERERGGASCDGGVKAEREKYNFHARLKSLVFNPGVLVGQHGYQLIYTVCTEVEVQYLFTPF